MIKPESLWGLFKTCEDSRWLGDICRALGRQKVELDFGQRQMMVTIQQDSGWMDERIEGQRERWRERQKKSRMSRDVTQSHSDKDESREVTNHPTIQPSNHPSITLSSERVDARAEEPMRREVDGRLVFVPTDEEIEQIARIVNIDKAYVPVFIEEMKAKDFTYVNRAGVTVQMNRRNAKAVMSSFFQQWKKNKAVGGDTSIRRADYKPVYKKAGEA